MYFASLLQFSLKQTNINHTQPTMSQVNICRLCLNICKHYRSLYDKNGFGTEVYSLIIKYFDSTILNMELEKHLTAVCFKCWHHLLNFNTFEQCVAEAQTKINTAEVFIQPQLIKSERDSDNIELNNEEEFIYLEESETQNVQQHEEFSIEFISEGGDGADQLSGEFEDLKDNSLNGYFIADDAKGNITLPQLEFVDGGKMRSDEVDNPPQEIKQSTGIITDNTSPTDGNKNKNYNTNNAKDYDDTKTQRKSSVKCLLCSESYPLYSSLREHCREKHPNDDINISCCQLKFSNLKLFDEHIRLLHLNSNDFKCEICGNVYTSSRKLADHLLMEHSGLRIKRSFECPKCPLRYHSEARYKLHLAEHDNCEHNCSHCGKMCSTGNRRLLHECLSHGIHRHCKECDKSFRDNHDFTQHLLEHDENNDAGDPSNICTACGLISKTASDMRLHMATHTKANIYVCSHCPKTFQYRASLRNHMKKKHSEQIQY